jgi:hypothetical protein
MTNYGALITGMSGDFAPRIIDLEKQYLGLPNKSDYNTLSQTNSSNYNTFNTELSSLKETVEDLVSYVVNLKLAHTALYTGFTGHSSHPPGA